MLRIEPGRVRETASELAAQAGKAAGYRLQLSDIAQEISRLAYTEDVAGRLRALSDELEEIACSLTCMGEALEEIAGVYENTERDIAEVYEQEKPAYQRPVIGQSRIWLNPRLSEIARIEL